MYHALLPHCFATLIEFKYPPYMIAMVMPIAGMILAVTIIITSKHYSHRRRELWHATARIALEKGQPIPRLPDDDINSENLRELTKPNDIRTGLILMAAGGGIFLFMSGVGAREVALGGAIPGLIGLAMLLYGLGSAKRNASSDSTPRT